MEIVKDFFNSSILNELCDLRTEELDTAYMRAELQKQNDTDEEIIDPEHDFIELVNIYVKDKNQQIEIKRQADIWVNAICEDVPKYIRRAYKLGFIDATKLKKEVQDIIKKDCKNH